MEKHYLNIAICERTESGALRIIARRNVQVVLDESEMKLYAFYRKSRKEVLGNYNMPYIEVKQK